MESNGFLKFATKAGPEYVHRGALILENSLISFLLDGPENESWEKRPESIEKDVLERVKRPMPNGVNDVPFDSSSLSATLHFFVPKLVCS